MTNAEIELKIAIQLMNEGRLNSFESAVIQDMQNFTKKDLRKLSKKQYDLLKRITDKF